MLVSAIVNSGVQELATMSLKKPLMVDADVDAKKLEHENFSTPHQPCSKHFIIVSAKARLVGLTCFLCRKLDHNDVNKKSKIVVFMSTCDTVDSHYALFGKTAWPAGRKKNDSNNNKKDANEDESSASTARNVSSSLFGSNASVFRLHGNASCRTSA